MPALNAVAAATQRPPAQRCAAPRMMEPRNPVPVTGVCNVADKSTLGATGQLLPLIGVPRPQLDRLSAALGETPIDEGGLRALIAGGFHATALAQADTGHGLVGQLVDKALGSLLPGVDECHVVAWRAVLETALQKSPREWEVACLKLRPLLWPPSGLASPLLRDLRAALYRPFDLSREAWQQQCARLPEACPRELALHAQNATMKGWPQDRRERWAAERLRELASEASATTIAGGMEDVRRISQKDRGLIDPRWGLPAVFEHAQGGALDSPDRPREVVAVWERLAAMERHSGPSDPTQARAPAPVAGLAKELLDVAHAAAIDPQPHDGPLGKYDSWANTLVSLLYVPGGLDGLRTTVADAAFAWERASTLGSGATWTGSRVARVLKGFVSEDRWMKRVETLVDSTEPVDMDVRRDLEGPGRAGTAVAAGSQCRAEMRTVPGRSVEFREQVNAFLGRQGWSGQGAADAALNYTRRPPAPASGDESDTPYEWPGAARDLAFSQVAPQALAGALTDTGPRWLLPETPGPGWGAHGATATGTGSTAAPVRATARAPAALARPSLLSADAWGKREVANFILGEFAEGMESLDSDQQAAYIKAYREKGSSARQLDGALRSSFATFETRQRAFFSSILEHEMGRKLDLENTFIHTKVEVVPAKRNVLDLGRAAPTRNPQTLSRPKRAVGEWEPVVTWQSQSLWQAVKDNYAYNCPKGGWSASSLLSPSSDPLAPRFPATDPRGAPDVDVFIKAVRGFDLGRRTRETMPTWLGDGIEHGRHDPLVQGMLRDEFAFDAIEALRDEANSGVTPERYQRLVDAFRQKKIQAFPLLLRPGGIGMATRLPAFRLSVPGSRDAFVYFPQRPDGALRAYPDIRSAALDLDRQFVDGDATSDTWLGRQLPIGKRAAFFVAQKIKVKPEGLNWLASPLYDLFNPHQRVRPKSFRIEESPGAQPFDQARIQSFRHRWLDGAFASTTTTGERDFAAFERGFNEVLSEMMQWLSVAGIPGKAGKAVMGAFVALAVKDLVSGAMESSTTDGSGLAQAIENILTMALFAGSQAGMEHLTPARVDALVASVNDPVLHRKADGGAELVRPDWDAYAASGDVPPLTALSGREGVIAHASKRFARLEKDGVTRLVEVEPVAGSASDRYRVVSPDTALREMHVVYDRAMGQWMPDFEDISMLGDAALMARMLSSGKVSANDAGLVLDIAGVDRVLLEGIWSDTVLAPSWLVEAASRVRARAELRDLEGSLAAADGMAPPVADEVMGKLLADVTGRGVKIYQDGYVVEHALMSSTRERPIELVRLGENHYVPLNSVVPNRAVPGRFAMIDALVDADPRVGRGPGGGESGSAQRRNVLGEQVLARVRGEPQSLYDYLLARRGLVNRDAFWSKKNFVSTPPAGPVVTSLRKTYPTLTDVVAREFASSAEIRRRVLLDERDPGIDLLVGRHAVHSRVQQAREQLHYGAFTADGEALALTLWTRLPEWPRDVRVEVMKGIVSFGGKIVGTDTLLGSYGAADATSTVRILRVEDGRYAAVGSEGGSRGDVVEELRGDQLPTAVLRSMTDSQRIRLGIDIDNSGRLRQRGREVAAVLDVDALHDFIKPEGVDVVGADQGGKRCKRAGDSCAGASTLTAAETETANWMPPETELIKFRDALHAVGKSPVLPQTMVSDMLRSMHFREPSDFITFWQSVAAIVNRGTPYFGLPDYVVRHLGVWEDRYFQRQVGSHALNRGLAIQAYEQIRESYEASNIKSGNKRYDGTMAGPDRASKAAARVDEANRQINDMRAEDSAAAPDGGLSHSSFRTVQRVKTKGVGNCLELAFAAADVITLKGFRAEVWHIVGGDHVFTVVGHPPTLEVPGSADVAAGEAYGFEGDGWQDLWVADPWLGVLCEAGEYREKALEKLTKWEACGKEIWMPDRDRPGYSKWALPDAEYRKDFSRKLQRKYVREGYGPVSLARQRFHDVIRQAEIPVVDTRFYDPASDGALTRQSTSAVQDADMVWYRDNRDALDRGPSLEVINRFINEGQFPLTPDQLDVEMQAL